MFPPEGKDKDEGNYEVVMRFWTPGKRLEDRSRRDRAPYQHWAQQGGLELHVWTDFDNAPAIGLYKGVGFMQRALLLELQA